MKRPSIWIAISCEIAGRPTTMGVFIRWNGTVEWNGGME